MTPSTGARSVNRSTSRRRSLRRRSLSASAALRRRQLVVGFRIDAAEPFQVFDAQFALRDFSFGSHQFALDFHVVELADHVAAADRFAGSQGARERAVDGGVHARRVLRHQHQRRRT